MAITIDEVKSLGAPDQGFKERRIKATLGNYTTGGYPITAADANLKKILHAALDGNPKGYPCQAIPEDTNNGVLIKCWSAAGTEMANGATTLANEVIYVRVRGY